MKIIFIFLILSIGSIACKSKYRKAADEIAANSPPPTNMNAGKEKYTIYIPKGWTTEHKEAYGVNYYYLLAPKTEDDPNTNINITSEFMQNLSLEDYLSGTIRSVKKGIPSAVILGQGEIAANELKGVWYSYKMEAQDIRASLVSYVFPKNGIAYIITAGTQTRDFMRYKDTFDRVAKSFRFINE